jgi:hypothetical protein
MGWPVSIDWIWRHGFYRRRYEAGGLSRVPRLYVHLPETKCNPHLLISRYSKFYAARGAKVVVNDVSAQAAQAVVDEIKKGKPSVVIPPSTWG